MAARRKQSNDDDSNLVELLLRQKHSREDALAIDKQGTKAAPLHLTGRSPTILYLSWDPDSLSPYQVLLRKNIELFEAQESDVDSHSHVHAALPTTPIVAGQVGIRCIHCAHVRPASARAPGACYFPGKREGVYQAAQNLGKSHLFELCPCVPDQVRVDLMVLRAQKASGKKGKKAWADRLIALGRWKSVAGDYDMQALISLTSYHPFKFTSKLLVVGTSGVYEYRGRLRFAPQVNSFSDQVGSLE